MATPDAYVAADIAARVGREGRRPRVERRTLELLERVPLFSGLSRRQLRRIASLGREVSVPAGRTIVERGVRGDAFYLILDGSAKVYRAVVPTGRAIARLGSGDFFGEMALLDGGPRTATVVAQTRIVALRVPRRSFRQLLVKEPSVAVAMLEEMAQRARRREPITSQ